MIMIALINNVMSEIRKRKNENGSALAYGLIIMFCVSIILTSMIAYISSQLKFSFNRVEKEKAFQLSEAGIYYYRWYLAHVTSGKTAEQIQEFWENGNPIGVAEAYEDDYEGLGEYSVEVEPPSSGSTIITIRSTGYTYKNPNVKRTVQVRFRRPSWSEYIFLSNSFINFGDEADVYGKVHSNAGIRFDGLAHNTVSALPYSFNDPSHGGSELEFGVHTHRIPADPDAPEYPWPEGTVPDRPDIFIGGREFPIPEVSFSGVSSDLTNMKEKAEAGIGRYFDSDWEGRRIILKNDGTFDVCTVETYHSTRHSISTYRKNDDSGSCSTCAGECLSNYPIVDNGVIFVENDIWVEGIVNSRNISVVAANLTGEGYPANIYIGLDNTSVRYADYSCSNIAGLVAQNNITIVRSCPNNMIIDAALLAQEGRVGISNTVPSKNSLTFNGAIVSYLQPFFAHGVDGFAERSYNFDNNLLYCPPPYFPTGNEYYIDLWEEI
jgi:hypothetical protein